jgi:hypothetical protein
VLLVVAACATKAQDKTISDVGAYYSIPIQAGPNFISAPLNASFTHRDLITTVTSNSVTFTNAPGFAAGQFSPTNGFDQYIVLVIKDADKAVGNSNNVTGDWWPVVTNTANTITVGLAGSGLTNLLSPGDVLELRRLVSLKDLFGEGTNCFLYKDPSGNASTAECDVIRTMIGLSFGNQITYLDTNFVGQGSPEGYYINGSGPVDGATITLMPDEPIEFFRKDGASETNLLIRGVAQATPLTHYINPSVETFGQPFAVGSPVGASGLREHIEANGAASVNLFANILDEDVVREVIGTSLASSLILNTNGNFYIGTTITNDYLFQPGRGWAYYIKPSTGGRAWRQRVPYSIPPSNYIPALKFLPPSLAAGNVMLTLSAHETNRSYAMYWRTNLAVGANWALLTNGAVGQSQFTNLMPSTSNAFFVAFSSQDTDGDGLTDGFESVVFLSSTTSVNTDGDPYSDWVEFLQGRNPRVPGESADTGAVVNLRLFTPLR